jgi:tetratricopeptide (TPR) repeat protein
VTTVDVLLEPYVEAQTVEDAERALDRLEDAREIPSGVLGECYDELAGGAADSGDFDAAVRLQRRAIELGCRHETLARLMLAWYLISAGRLDEGEERFAELRREDPADADLVVALGIARSEVGLDHEALAAFDDAVTIAKATGDAGLLDRARVERREHRKALRLPADEDDRLAPLPRRLRADGVEWAVAWFPPDQRAGAVERWPGLAEDFADPVAYSRRIEGHLSNMREVTGQRPKIAAIDVEELVAWADREHLDPDSGEARSRFAAELSRTGRALRWPRGRNEPCWCCSGRKYKRCCGANPLP